LSDYTLTMIRGKSKREHVYMPFMCWVSSEHPFYTLISSCPDDDKHARNING
jgi:hypothetical protein